MSVCQLLTISLYRLLSLLFSPAGAGEGLQVGVAGGWGVCLLCFGLWIV